MSKVSDEFKIIWKKLNIVHTLCFVWKCQKSNRVKITGSQERRGKFSSVSTPELLVRKVKFVSLSASSSASMVHFQHFDLFIYYIIQYRNNKATEEN